MTKSSNIIYCHGLPGSSHEIKFLEHHDSLAVHVFGPQHSDEIFKLTSSSLNRSVHVIGFSLGAMAAIKIAAQHHNKVSMMSLIAPAAPLELGNFLPGMAGRVVFQTASRSALQFRALTALQKISVRLSSKFVIQSMFKGSPESEAALLQHSDFKESLLAGFKDSYGKNQKAYRSEIHDYMKSWAYHLESINCPVKIYHGASDNWAPVDMAYALKDKIPSKVDVIEYRGLGHFSTLRKALPLVINNQMVD